MSKKVLILAGAGGLIVVLFGVLFTFIVSGGDDPKKNLRLAISLLEEDRWDVAGRIARDLDAAKKIDRDKDSDWNYVQGVSMAQSVREKLDLPQNRETLWTATSHLEKSRDLGFPLGYKGIGQFYLGSSYFHTFKWPQAAATLTEAAANWPQRRSDALSLAVQAALRQQPSDAVSAAKSLAIWKAIPGLADEEKDRIILGEAEVAFVIKDIAQCESALSKIPETSPAFAEANLLRGRWRLEVSDEKSNAEKKDQLLTTAVGLFRKSIQNAETPNETRRHAAYLLGRALRAQGKFEEALGTLSGVRQRNPQSAEAVAAGMEEAEILFQINKIDPSLNTIRHILRDMGDIKVYNQQWMPIADLRRRLLDLGRQFRLSDHYKAAVDLAGYLPPVFPRADSVRLQAEAYRQWAEVIEAEVQKDDGAAQRQQVGKKYGLAGNFFEELARLELRSVDYPNIAWQSVDCYEKAGDLEAVNRVLDNYLRYVDRTQQPRGFLALGKNFLNAGKPQKAIAPLERCIKESPPAHPDSHEARFLMAQAYSQQEKLDQATELLMQNLFDSNLEPSNEIWRNSLFELGKIAFRRGEKLQLESQKLSPSDWSTASKKLEESQSNLLDAVRQLSEASDRWKSDPRYFETRYLIGKSHQMAAEYPAKLITSNQIVIDSVKRQLVQQRRKLLENALTDFQHLHQDLNAVNEDDGLTKEQLSILRNCYFGEADALFQLQRYEDAILAYRNVGNRFLNQPESLEALVQISECQRLLGQTEASKRSLQQAEQVLKRIPSDFDSQFLVVTRASRANWPQLLTWMQTW
jgi:tetratricopeptide (TPR) repeat protein